MSNLQDVSSFIIKTYKMVNACHSPEPPEIPGEVCCWADDGNSFIIKDVNRFTDMLPHFFKHKNFRSFVRQLNFYGFRKVRAESALYPTRPPDWSEFKHDYFRRDQPELLSYIKRAANGVDAKPPAVSHAPPPPAPRSDELFDVKKQVYALQQQVTMLTSMVTQLYADNARQRQHPQDAPADGDSPRSSSSAHSENREKQSSYGRQPASSFHSATRKLEGVPLSAVRGAPTQSLEILREIIGRDGALDSTPNMSAMQSMSEDDIRAMMNGSFVNPSFDASNETAAASAMTALSRYTRSKKPTEVTDSDLSESVKAEKSDTGLRQTDSLEGQPLKRARTSGASPKSV